jgi:hypothetical protein
LFALNFALIPFFMPILSNIQSRLTALLLNILFIGTAMLGAVLIATQKLLAWLDGYHPQLNQASLVFQGWLKRYPKTIVASLASVLVRPMPTPQGMPTQRSMRSRIAFPLRTRSPRTP